VGQIIGVQMRALAQGQINIDAQIHSVQRVGIGEHFQRCPAAHPFNVGPFSIIQTSVPDPKLTISDPDPQIENQEFRGSVSRSGSGSGSCIRILL